MIFIWLKSTGVVLDESYSTAKTFLVEVSESKRRHTTASSAWIIFNIALVKYLTTFSLMSILFSVYGELVKEEVNHRIISLTTRFLSFNATFPSFYFSFMNKCLHQIQRTRFKLCTRNSLSFQFLFFIAPCSSISDN